jgi:8-oxo-dGTP pyrophosphatase MutT (NUDIX family)
MILLTNRIKQEFPVFKGEPPTDNMTAAVMIIIYLKERNPYIILIRRSRDLRRHPGEIGFPGGIYEEEDQNLLVTAQRETFEEINIWVEEALIIGRLDKVKTLTGFEITPFVALIDHCPVYEPNFDEVEHVFDIPLFPLLTTQHPDTGFKASMQMIAFWHKENRIWGATAKILRQIAGLKGY